VPFLVLFASGEDIVCGAGVGGIRNDGAVAEMHTQKAVVRLNGGCSSGSHAATTSVEVALMTSGHGSSCCGRWKTTKNAYFWIASIVADGDMGTEAARCTVLIY
jgi:hypothetical protein